MNTLIVYNHPYTGSFCRALLESAQKGFAAAGHTVDTVDLDADGFNPVMSAADLKAFVQKQAVDPQALDYIQRLKNADHLVLIFPIWWELMPAMMKGFIDKVIFPGGTYDNKASGMGMVSLLPRLKSVRIITTMNTPGIIYRLLFGNAIKGALVRGTFQKTGCKNVKWISFNQVKGSPEAKRTRWLEQVYRLPHTLPE